jgi:hypothetical protein
MAITVCPVTPSFAAEVGDVDLAAQIEPANLRAIADALAQYAVLIFSDQRLSQDQHLDFARHFGPLETSIAVYRKEARLRLRKEFADVSNLDHDNELWRKESRLRLFQLSNRLWHTDSSFKRVPARFVALCAFDPASGRPHRICRRTGGLRCASRGNETASRSIGGRAFDLQFPRAACLHQFQRRGAAGNAAGATGAGPHHSGNRA